MARNRHYCLAHAAGTLVIRRPMTQVQARAEVARQLPFVAEIIVCRGRDIARLVSQNPFEGLSAREVDVACSAADHASVVTGVNIDAIIIAAKRQRIA